MKKVLSIVAVLMLLASSAFAADTIKNGKYGAYVQGGYAIADVGTGYAADVDSDGAVSVAEKVSSATTKTADGAAVATAAVVKAILVNATTAKDFVLIKDGTTTVFDVAVGVAGDSRIFQIPGGVSFATDVYVDVNFGATGASVTIVYN